MKHLKEGLIRQRGIAGFSTRGNTVVFYQNEDTEIYIIKDMPEDVIDVIRRLYVGDGEDNYEYCVINNSNNLFLLYCPEYWEMAAQNAGCSDINQLKSKFEKEFDNKFYKKTVKDFCKNPDKYFLEIGDAEFPIGFAIEHNMALQINTYNMTIDGAEAWNSMMQWIQDMPDAGSHNGLTSAFWALVNIYKEEIPICSQCSIQLKFIKPEQWLNIYKEYFGL